MKLEWISLKPLLLDPKERRKFSGVRNILAIDSHRFP